MWVNKETALAVSWPSCLAQLVWLRRNQAKRKWRKRRSERDSLGKWLSSRLLLRASASASPSGSAWKAPPSWSRRGSRLNLTFKKFMCIFFCYFSQLCFVFGFLILSPYVWLMRKLGISTWWEHLHLVLPCFRRSFPICIVLIIFRWNGDQFLSSKVRKCNWGIDFQRKSRRRKAFEILLTLTWSCSNFFRGLADYLSPATVVVIGTVSFELNLIKFESPFLLLLLSSISN